MSHHVYSLHKIQNDISFSFSPSDYSLFKYGDESIANVFGTGLAEGFIKNVLATHKPHQQLVVISSPYSFIPTATFAMKKYFVYGLNRWLAEKGLPVVQETKVHRTITYKEDYGELNAEERMRLIGNDSFHVDSSFLEGKTLIFLDDIKITGSHERVILRMMEQYNLQHHHTYMLYFAELINKDIPANIENHLNYYAVKSIFDLNPIVGSGHFCFNTRIVKYILCYEHDAFCVFMQNKPESFCNQLYDLALGNGYHLMDEYSKNLNFIKDNLFTKKSKFVTDGN
ncbi:MAG: hypothetical protein EOP56_13460 [Sphingobacteriales bacterium]|nr:MAG: hypothetical protein EOP56_13460 [Sphingobacteriales bacterium]